MIPAVRMPLAQIGKVLGKRLIRWESMFSASDQSEAQSR